VVLESQDLCGELSNDAGGGRLTRQGNALRLGGGESLASEALESFDAAVSEVSSDSLVSRSPELCWALVVGQEGKGLSPVLRSNARSKTGDSNRSASPRRVMVLFWSVTRSRRRPSRIRS
jgi:hypothetical protein